MGFLSNGAMMGIGQGLNAGADNFAKLYMFKQQQALEAQRLAQQKALQEAQIREHDEKVAQSARERMAMQQAPIYPENSMGLSGEIEPLPQAPLSLAERARRFSEVNPTAGLKDEIALAGQQQKEGLTLKDIISNADKLDDKTLDLFGRLYGIDLKAYRKDKAELMPGIGPDGKPIMVPKVAGAAVYEKPDSKETWGEPYEANIGGKRAMVQKSSHGQIRPVIEDKSTTTTINMQTPSAEEVEVVAQLLADGKITMNDISKRGGVKQQAAILKRAAELNPSLDPRADQAATSAFAGSLAFQQKQLGAMGSFVRNMDYQVSRVKDLAEELKTFDSRIMNVPLRALRGKIAGSPLQAKYDMYITEIENEIGKLATGSAASVAELTAGAQEKWAKIHDKNLSVGDMISLLEETSKAGKMRMQSVQDQLKETQTQMRGRGNASAPSGIPQGAIDRLKSKPHEAALFDLQFGKGAAKRILGGK